MVSIAGDEWQKRSWEFYDNVGEFRFGAGWIGNGLSRVNLIAAAVPETQGDDPAALVGPDPEDENDNTPPLTRVQTRAKELVDMIGGGPIGQGEILQAFGIYSTVSGEGFLVAEPSLLDPEADVIETWAVISDQEIRNKAGAQPGPDMIGQADRLYEIVDEVTGQWRSVHPNTVIVRVWRPHPARRSKPDAPARAAFKVLRLIELLSDRTIADAQSRLAGAGILVLPESVEFPPQPGITGRDGDEAEDDGDQFIHDLHAAMTIPITNRDSAAAVVPLVIKVPDDVVDKITWISFSTPFDAKVMELLEGAIKRLALALDMPPEVLTGMSGVNHWTAWQVEETAITLHIAPLAEMISQALTEGFLAPALKAEAFSDVEIASVMTWYDTTDLQTRPDKSANATEAYDRVELSGKALRREMGLDEEDRPDEDEFKQRILLQAAKGAPTLAPQMLAAAGILDAEVADAADAANPATGASPPADGSGAAPAADGPPVQEDQPPEAAAASGVLAAADMIVRRAVERANSRLRTAAGKGLAGGAATIRVPAGQQLHETVGDVTSFADLDSLLAGAWAFNEYACAVLAIDEVQFTEVLNQYVRATLAGGMPHETTRLATALGLVSVPV